MIHVDEVIQCRTEHLSVAQLRLAENINNGRIAQVWKLDGVMVIGMEGDANLTHRWHLDKWERFAASEEVE